MAMSKKLVEELQIALRQVTQDPKKPFQTLVNSGVITEEGRLADRYRGPGKYVSYTIEEEDTMRRLGDSTIADRE